MKGSVVVGLLLLAALMGSIFGSGANRCYFISGFSASYLSAGATALSSSFNYTVTLTTSMGAIVIGMFDDMSITSGNFENLTQLGYYDNTIFHRVVHDFVIQGGDLNGKGITVPTIPDELPNRHSNMRGFVAMAKTTMPSSATSQFYINLVDNTFLDSNYSVFGEVIQGMDVVDSIGSVETDINDRPLQDVIVLTARLHSVEGTGPVYIRADGSIDPPDAPISTLDNVTYTLTDNITTDADGIVVERDNIVIDGAGYMLQGTGSGNGIDLSRRSNVTVKNAEISKFETGILLFLSSGNILTANTFSHCGLFVYDSLLNKVEGNTVNNEPLIYLEGVSSYIVGDAGQVMLINCDGIQVRNLNLSETTVGIHLWKTNNSIIENNTAVGNTICGLLVYYSYNNSISLNNITDNNYDGIELSYSGSNTIFGNNITSNTISGIELWEWDSANNSIVGNTIANNSNGIVTAHSSYNSVYHNNFVNNTYQVPFGSLNVWDNGCEGNYWSNYNGTDLDNDGVGDTLLPCEGVDNYPLMNVYRNPCDINHDLKVNMKDVGISAKAFGTISGDAKWNPHADITGPDGVPDGKVDMRDISLIAKHFGERYLSDTC
jgi:peptidylprolyl isomerase